MNEKEIRAEKKRLIALFIAFSETMFNEKNEDINILAQDTLASAFFKQIAIALKLNLSHNGETLYHHLRYLLNNSILTDVYPCNCIRDLYKCLFNNYHFVRILIFFQFDHSIWEKYRYKKII